MSLRESQNFFYELCAKPETISALKKNKGKVLKKYFSKTKDRDYLSTYPFERFQTYRNHISYGILGGISSCFPVIKSLVSDKEWTELLNNFYLKRLTRSPIARQVFGEFSLYLQKYRGPLLKKLPYLKELAEYEYLDLKIFFEKDLETPSLLQDLPSNPYEILSWKPILNPHIATRLYQWPVHRICKEYYKPSRIKKGRYGLIVYRDPDTLKARFVEANTPMIKLVESLGKKPSIKKLLTVFSPEVFSALGFLKEKHIILGYQQKETL